MLISSKELEIGQFVKSKAGRDKDRVFIVIKRIDEQFVHVADGDLRKLEKPKLKKVKHLIALNYKSSVIEEKILENKLSNSTLRKEIEKAGLI